MGDNTTVIMEEPVMTAPSTSQSWSDIQERTFTRWVNYHLRDRDVKVGKIHESLKDGIALINLMEVLTGKTARRYFKTANNRIQYFNNVDIGLKMVRAEGIELVNIGAADLVDQKYTPCMGLIWELIGKYSVKRGKKDVLRWVNDMVGLRTPYKLDPRKFVENFTSGTLACCLVDACKPGCIDVANLPATPIERAQLAVSTGETLGIPPVIDPQDMINPNIDDLSLVTFLGGCQAVCPEPPAYEEFTTADLPLKFQGLYVEVADAPPCTITTEEGQGNERGLIFKPHTKGGAFQISIMWNGVPLTTKPIVVNNG
eukprot:m.37963 g.37963  ORF g.37963 m.37963 type:complete len:314 (+) comp11444_c0_seq1:199-1140(+)